MHPMKLLATVCCLALGLRRVEANLPTANPSVVEFGAADAALVQCFEKTFFALSRSPAAVSFLSPKNINYVRVETLTPGLYGGVTAEITSGAIKKPNIVITLTEPAKRPFLKSNVKVTMFCEK